MTPTELKDFLLWARDARIAVHEVNALGPEGISVRCTDLDLVEPRPVSQAEDARPEPVDPYASYGERFGIKFPKPGEAE